MIFFTGAGGLENAGTIFQTGFEKGFHLELALPSSVDLCYDYYQIFSLR
ncbi:MAG: hypothetical protein ACOX0J_08065 [Thermoactinomyces vulgaris]